MLVTALDFTLPDAGQTASIVYIPEGVHSIRPCVNGKPQTVTISLTAESGERVAASFQASLAKRLAANVRPTFDFDHKDIGPASALPKRFYYEAGKGLMAEVEWTGAGRKAIESKDYSYFSPTFLMDDNGVPAGIPERGPLGALVNEPAFRDIPRIAASQAADPEHSIEEKPMSKLIFAALAINASATDAEADAVKAIEKLKTDHASVQASLVSVEQERDALKAQVEAANKARAESLVKAAVADGRIAPKDEEKQTKFRDKIEAGDTFAEEMLAQLPKLNPGIDQVKVTAASGEKLGDGGDFMAEAKKLVTAGEAKTEEEAMGLIAARNPALYDSYTESLVS
ncbi:phage protease (plasmid) [Verrucomicrobiaceae bacterium 227]